MFKDLFEEFDLVSKKYWKQILQYQQQGELYENLISHSPEGIDISPIYTFEDRKDHKQLVSTEPFEISQRFYLGKNNPEIKAQIDEAVESGTQKIILEVHHKFEDSQQLHTWINPLVNYQIELRNIDFYQWSKWIDLANQHDCVKLLVDPIGDLELKGYFPNNFTWSAFGKLIDSNEKLQILLNINHHQEAGAISSDQISFALAKAKEYLEQLNYPIGLQFHLSHSIGQNYFFEIAKISSFKFLWATLGEHLGQEYPVKIHSKSSTRYFSILDYNSNILRSSTASLAGLIGGSDSIEQVPYDLHFKNKNTFSERVARNQLLILKYETHVEEKNWVDGTYYLSYLTEQLSQKALSYFKELEAKGGYLSQINEQKIQEKIMLSHAQEFQEFERGNLSIIGLNKYPDLQQLKSLNLERPILHKSTSKTIQTIHPIRLGAQLELKLLNDEK